MEVYCPNCGSEECKYNPRFSTYKCTECGCEFDDEEVADFEDEDFDEDFSDSWSDDYEYESEQDYADLYDE